MNELLEEGVRSKTYSGAVAAIVPVRGPATVLTAGTTQWGDEGIAVQDDTYFDLASLTKVLVTTTILAQWVSDKKCNLDALFSKYLPELPWESQWRDITFRDVLSHRAGFVPWIDLAKVLFEKNKERVPPRKRSAFLMLNEIAMMEPSYPKGTKVVYSDIGFIVLGEWMARLERLPLHILFGELVQRPLDCASLLYRPLQENVNVAQIAATENVPWRGGMEKGEVNDDNAFLLEGVAGHAGLFGNAADCAKIGVEWLKALKGDSSIISQDTAVEFSARVNDEAKGTFGLGWDTAGGEGSSAGGKASKGTFGHLGFTGTSIWLDPIREVSVVLLTNRVHPSSKNDSIRSFRPKFYDEIWKALDS